MAFAQSRRCSHILRSLSVITQSIPNVLLRNYYSGSSSIFSAHFISRHSNLVPVLYSNCKSITPQQLQVPAPCIQNNMQMLREFQTSVIVMDVTKKGTEKDPKKKNEERDRKAARYSSPLITLIDADDKMSVISLLEAERIAKRRDLKLVQVADPKLVGKSERQTYKLITGRQFYEEVHKVKKGNSSAVKGQKILIISANIGDKDFAGKMKNVEKWVTKGNQVKVTITVSKVSQDVQSILKRVEEETERFGGRILQVQEKGENLKFYVSPAKK